MHGRSELAVQSGDWGYYAVVALDVETTAAFRGVRVDFVKGTNDWRRGVEFGIAYAYEKSLAAQPKAPGVIVQVVEFRGHDVDTTEAVAALVSARAFFAAIGANPPARLGLSEEKGEVVFPK